MSRHWGGRFWPWSISAAVVALLLAPLPHAHENATMRMASGAVHALLWSIVDWQLVGRVPVRLRGWPLWLGLAALAGLLELLQPRVGRSAEWADWICGMAGATAVIATPRWRAGWRITLILGIALIPPLWAGTLWVQEVRAFPVLVDPYALWARQGWAQHGGRIRIRDFSQLWFDSGPTAEEAEYPGLFRSAAHSDWRGFAALKGSMYWPEAVPVVMAVRVDDQRGNPPYAERFQQEMVATQGWNQIMIPTTALQKTPGGRQLRLDQIQQWGVFLVSPPPFTHFILGEFVLDQNKNVQ